MPSPLPPASVFAKDISRSSSSTPSSTSFLFQQPNFHTRTASLSAGRAEEYNRQQQHKSSLPGLSALASLATNKDYHIRSFSSNAAPGMNFASIPPIPTPGISGNHNLPPVCQNCQTSTTPLWRRDESGSVLCNACGLFLKLHGRPRPISLKTDVIKSRNRVKSANQGPKKKFDHPSLPASQSIDMMTPPSGLNAHRRVSQMAASVHSDRSHSPVSRTGTPSMHQDPNIAPQHIFDGVTLNDHTFQSPSLPGLINHPSPGSMNSTNDRHLEPPLTYEQLMNQHTTLRTRVSELEVINMMYSDNENTLRRERDDAVKTRDELKRKVEELEAQLRETQHDSEHLTKKARLSPSPGRVDNDNT